ncbi:MAG: LamG-like jellyroll fold domain-containing protein [Cyanobacteria bacterium P01_A01_bin.17]
MSELSYRFAELYPFLEWDFDAPAGNIAFDSNVRSASPGGSVKDGRLRNGTSRTDPGRLGAGRLYFDGLNDIVVDSDAETYLNGLDAITVSVWGKGEPGSDRGIFTTRANTGSDSFLGMRYDDQGSVGGGDDVIKIGLRTTQGVTYYESASKVHSAGVDTNDWQHLTMSWQSGGDIDFYIDGVKDNPTSGGRRLGGTTTGVQDLIVGDSSKGQNWLGDIDEFKIYDRKLSDAEVADLAALGDPPFPPDPGVDDTDPLMLWRLDADSSDVVRDSSGSPVIDGIFRGGAFSAGGSNSPSVPSSQVPDGIISSDAEVYATGRTDLPVQYAQFDGLNDSVIDLNGEAEANLNGLDEITVAMWVNAEERASDRGIFTTGSSNSDDLLGMRYDDQGFFGGGEQVIKASLRTDQGVIQVESSSFAQRNDEWQHVAMTWKSGGGINLYLDGDLDNSLTYSRGSIGGELTDIDQFILGESSRGDNWLGGSDEVVVYGRALNAFQIEAVYYGDYSVF